MYPRYSHQINETEFRNSLVKDTNEINRSCCPEVFCKKGILRNFAKFTGKHLCQSFFNKVEHQVEHQGLANNLIIFCEQCTWTHDFHSLFIVILSKVNDLPCKKTFSISTRNHFTKVRIPLRISSVNVTKSPVSFGFDHI